VATALESVPPPSGRAKLLRLTTTRLRHPRRFKGRQRAATVLDRVLARRGSNVEHAEAADVDERLVREWRSGEAIFALGDVYAIERRTALALLDEVRVDLLLESNPHR
jgi:hypothetical protein